MDRLYTSISPENIRKRKVCLILEGIEAKEVAKFATFQESLTLP